MVLGFLISKKTGSSFKEFESCYERIGMAKRFRGLSGRLRRAFPLRVFDKFHLIGWACSWYSADLDFGETSRIPPLSVHWGLVVGYFTARVRDTVPCRWTNPSEVSCSSGP